MYQNLTLFLIALALAIAFLTQPHRTLVAQQAPNTSGGDALWHLPKFGEDGWFIHAHSGKVRVCNMNKASVVGDRNGPKCSNWE